MMKPKFAIMLEKAVEDGVRNGYYRAYKHEGNPSEDYVIETIKSNVMITLYEYFDFE